MFKNRGEKGITLIVLVTTIIILLILAGISISMLTGQNGVLKQAGTAKEQSEITSEKEKIILAYNSYKMLSYTENGNSISNFQINLDNYMGENKAIATSNGKGFDILVKEKNYYYTIEEDESILGPEKIEKIEYPGDITQNGQLDGSEEKPYQIRCIEDLVSFSNMTNGTGYKYNGNTLEQITSAYDFTAKKVIFTKDLNFNSQFSYDNWERTDFADLNGNEMDGNKLLTEMTTETGFTQIGTFRGTIDGQGHKIVGLYINRTTEEEKVGFIKGMYNNGRVNNLNIYGNNIGKIISEKNSSGICFGSIPLNCYNIGIIEGTNRYGISNKGNITNCYYLAEKSGTGSGIAETEDFFNGNKKDENNKTFLEILNEEVDKNDGWAHWIAGKDKYPTLDFNNINVLPTME